MKSLKAFPRSTVVGRISRVVLVVVASIFLAWLTDRHVVFGGSLSVPFHRDASSPYAQLSLPGRRPLSAMPSNTNPLALTDGRLDIVLEPPRTFQTADIQLYASSCVDSILSGSAPFGSGTDKDVEFSTTAVIDDKGCFTPNLGSRILLDLIGNDHGKYQLTLKPANAGDQIVLTGIAITFEGQPISWSKIINWLKKI